MTERLKYTHTHTYTQRFFRILVLLIHNHEGKRKIEFTVQIIYCNVFRRKWKLSVGLGFEGQRHLSRLCSKVEYLKQDKEFLYAINELDMQKNVSILNTSKKFKRYLNQIEV